MKVQVAQWGNSAAMRFPKSVVEAMKLEPGTQLELVVEGRDIRLRRSLSTSRRLLEDMVEEAARLGPGYEPAVVDWGPDVGAEIVSDDDPR